MARILVIGATGFIGRHIVATLLERRHTVVGLHRGEAPPSLLKHPRFESVSRDLRKMDTADRWTEVIENTDAVINCAGVLQASARQMSAVHTVAPAALFQACTDTGLNRVIQISAISADADTPYAKTKRAADTALMESDLDWVIVRPSLVYGNGSYGGTSVMRGLAAWPWAIPMPGDGSQTFQPICMDDLVGIVCELCEANSFNKMVIEPVGPDVLTLKDILLKLRRWLDVPGERTWSVPVPIARALASFGNLLRWPTLDSNTLKKMVNEDTAPAASFQGLYAPGALRMDDVLTAHPSTVQDRYHARQMFLASLITLVLSVVWLTSGALEFLRGSPVMLEILNALSLNHVNPVLISQVLAGWYVLLGISVLLPLGTRLLTALQILTLLGHTAVVSWGIPTLWLNPLGPLLKTVLILMLIWMWARARGESGR